jgi:hypothetical protein
MKLSEELAKTCIDARLEKTAQEPDLQEARRRFEDLTSREQLHRRQAARLKGLARRRARREEGRGYLAAGAERLSPLSMRSIPEALLRAPLIAGGGAAGYAAARHFEPVSPSDLMRVIQPAEPENMKSIFRALIRTGLSRDQALSLVTGMQASDPKAVAMALGNLPSAVKAAPAIEKIPLVGSGVAQRLREAEGLRQAWGEPVRQTLREQILNIARQTAPEEGVARLLPKWRRMGGAAGGLALASALTGIPFALKAMWQKMYGGEDAARAEAEARRSLGLAEQTAGAREKILGGLGV